jgi:hypothetical protein
MREVYRNGGLSPVDVQVMKWVKTQERVSSIS